MNEKLVAAKIEPGVGGPVHTLSCPQTQRQSFDTAVSVRKYLRFHRECTQYAQFRLAVLLVAVSRVVQCTLHGLRYTGTVRFVISQS